MLYLPFHHLASVIHCLAWVISFSPGNFGFQTSSFQKHYHPAFWGDSVRSRSYRSSRRVRCEAAHEDDYFVTVEGGGDFLTKSRVVRLVSKNLGGITSPSGEEIDIEFPRLGSFLACTGETGSGKSVLVSKAAELLLGQKTSPRLLGLDATHNRTEVSAQIELHLREPHLSWFRLILKTHGLDDILSRKKTESSEHRLVCKRQVFLVKSKDTTDKSSSTKNFRLKSICEIDGHVVNLQVLSSVLTPLLAVVDGTKAASALSDPKVRVAILDATIPPSVLETVAQRKVSCEKVRNEREKLEASLKNRVFPKGYSLNNNDVDDARLLSHWIKELDAFQTRVVKICKSLDGADSTQSGILGICRKLALSDWTDNASSDDRFFSSKIYSLLGDLKEALRSLESRIVAARDAVHALTLLSSRESVLTALERARRLVDEAARGNRDDDSLMVEAAEPCHDILNELEEMTIQCAQYLENDRMGLIQLLDRERSQCPISIELIDEILLDWGTLARKHGVHPASLPSCHQCLIAEQSGKDHAATVLPQLMAKEQRLRNDFVESCRILSQLRQDAAMRLSTSVNDRLPSLGMKPTFQVRVDSSRLDNNNNIDKLLSLGADDVNFFIAQGAMASESLGGHVHLSASSGEKARILLAIDCAIPGSVTTACSIKSVSENVMGTNTPQPVLVIYDEIDSHVGGYAVTSLGMMLFDQARTKQILAITHSAAVAALADHHIRVQKLSYTDGPYTRVHVKTLLNNHPERTQELARMASGNMAAEEAEAFANALIRAGANMRNVTTTTANFQLK